MIVQVRDFVNAGKREKITTEHTEYTEKNAEPPAGAPQVQRGLAIFPLFAFALLRGFFIFSLSV
jgi:hypothetical protein